ncbi:hypothetical protein Z949_690 [Sulfitobacter guttiformis KCTC 32187]|nr:hypothetical protein Z949_690 [Sulfitobacter guttiformis KCTC 32187]
MFNQQIWRTETAARFRLWLLQALEYLNWTSFAARMRR